MDGILAKEEEVSSDIEVMLRGPQGILGKRTATPVYPSTTTTMYVQYCGLLVPLLCYM